MNVGRLATCLVFHISHFKVYKLYVQNNYYCCVLKTPVAVFAVSGAEMNQFHDWGPGDILKIHFLQKSTSCYLPWVCPPRRLVWRADIRTKHQLLGRFWGENWSTSSDFQDLKYILLPSLIFTLLQSSCIATFLLQLQWTGILFYL